MRARPWQVLVLLGLWVTGLGLVMSQWHSGAVNAVYLGGVVLAVWASMRLVRILDVDRK